MGYRLEELGRRGAPHVLDYLIVSANMKSTISYGRVAEWLAKDLHLPTRIFSTHVGHIVGTMMHLLQRKTDDVPLINVLVVNQSTGKPGSGSDRFLRDRFRVRSDATFARRRDDLIERAAREVYTFNGWRTLRTRTFGRSDAAADARAFIGTKQDGNPGRVSNRGGEAESNEHKRLKSFVHDNPNSIGLRNKPDLSKTEFLLLSGDEVDVYFETNGYVDLVEVKSRRSDWYDLQRGIYQCIKYRAVLNAQRKQLMPFSKSAATLVIETRPSNELLALAKAHDVRVLQVIVR